MPIVVEVKGILPKLIPVEKLRRKLTSELRKEGARNRRSLERTTKGWDDEKPVFKSTIRQRRNLIILDTQPTGNQHGVDKFKWLNAGTDVRFAAMTPDFQAKTKPGRLVSKSGKGGFMRMVNKDMGGIEARRWTVLITEKRQGPFEQNIQKVILTTAIFGG